VDDLVAAFFVLLCLALIKVLLPTLGGWFGPGTL
jgi:hypothetical protein